MENDSRKTERDLRWPRLFALFLWNFCPFFAGWFLWDFFSNIWTFGLREITVHSVLVSIGKALMIALFFGVFMTFATWLSHQIFGSSASRRPGA